MGNDETSLLARITHSFHENVVCTEELNGNNLIGTDVLIGRCCSYRAAPVAHIDDNVAARLDQCSEHACEVGLGIGISGVDSAFAFVQRKGEEVIVDRRRARKYHAIVVL